MNKNPFVNAFLAATYIVVVALAFRSFQTLGDKPDTILAPITMISLFTLSAGVMGLLFAYEPVRLLVSGEKQQALNFLIKGLVTFSCFVILFIVLLFLI